MLLLTIDDSALFSKFRSFLLEIELKIKSGYFKGEQIVINNFDSLQITVLNALKTLIYESLSQI